MATRKKLSDEKLTAHIEATIPDFHQARLESLRGLKLRELLRTKNPYLYRAKNILFASELVHNFLAARLSSQEEAIFGTFLEKLAIFVAGEIWNGRKSAIKGIDLEFEKAGVLHIVTIKSGPDWGNDSQIQKMRDYFRSAARTLRTNAPSRPLVFVNGCCYGRTTSENKGDYLKLCGQSFWEFLSDDMELYRRIIVPIGHRAKERNDEFSIAFANVVNQFTKELLVDFCHEDGSINWDSLLAFNSGRTAQKRQK
ncbi:MAG TPA: PmeII family type II restriction endonuclease [Verrucomicrobiota bacterium]|nr:PmeII family type II restriction endonuclease [Verrucomicrobiota bacterium]